MGKYREIDLSRVIQIDVHRNCIELLEEPIGFGFNTMMKVSISEMRWEPKKVIINGCLVFKTTAAKSLYGAFREQMLGKIGQRDYRTVRITK